VGSFHAGRILFQPKKYSAAILAYRRVLEEKRKARLETQVFSRLGYAHFYLKNYDEAIVHWERVITEFPNSPERNEILYWLAEIFLIKQDYRRAAERVDKLKEDPSLYPKGLNSLAWYQFQRKEWKEANQNFLKILADFLNIGPCLPFP